MQIFRGSDFSCFSCFLSHRHISLSIIVAFLYLRRIISNVRERERRRGPSSSSQEYELMHLSASLYNQRRRLTSLAVRLSSLFRHWTTRSPPYTFCDYLSVELRLSIVITCSLSLSLLKDDWSVKFRFHFLGSGYDFHTYTRTNWTFWK
jgi:hypothetical protein